jgi:hypothetical protein
MQNDNLITACFVLKLGRVKGGNEHVTEFLEKGHFVFRIENYRFFSFLPRRWKNS